MVDHEQSAKVEAIDPGEAILMAKAGRPTKLTQELSEALCAHIAKGVSIQSSAPLVGVCRRSVTQWLKRGAEEREQDATTIYTQFLRAFEKAQSEFESWGVSQVRKSAENGNANHACWLLERHTYTRERWRRPTQAQEIHVSGSGSDEEKLESLPDRIAAMAKKVQR